MIPVVIPAPDGACLGMYQPGPGVAMLICPPFGDEALRTARVWRDLALTLAGHGVATLRFDLPGTGNSAGDPTDADRVGAWRRTVRSCSNWLQARHARPVMLFGYRFGALLALDAAAGGVPAERLILLDPPSSGAALVRHLRGRARLDAFGPPPDGPDYIQAGGVPLSQATLRALSAMPAPIAGSGFPPALLVLNDDTGPPSPWPARLREAGSTVTTASFKGFEDFAPVDAFRAKTPTAVLDQVIRYVVDSSPALDHDPRMGLPSMTPALTFDGYVDQPIAFGPSGGMFGMLCRPRHPAPDVPALLLPTMGVDPCSGLTRMWTELARRIAMQGVASLRFDMTGVGESDGRLEGDLVAASYHPDRIADLRRAVDTMVERGFDRVNVAGYCSGAYAAWHSAVSDRRISSILTGNLVYLNLQETLAADVLRRQPGVSRLGLRQGSGGRGGWVPGVWMAALRHCDDYLRRSVPRPVRHLLRGLGSEEKQTRQHVRALTTRGCTVSMVVAEDDHGHHRLRRAFGETPRLPPGVHLTVIPDSDHQFSARRHRGRFLDLAADFAVRPYRPTGTKAALPATALKATT